MSEYLSQLAKEHSVANHRGIYSVCSAHPWVLEAALRHALNQDGPLLIEATCNQVNQFGGYTGMTPGAFRKFVESIADRVGFPRHRIILGGDHLGPHPWTHLPADQAMQNAIAMVQQYVREGFTKIHLDTSMACAGESSPLHDDVIAKRATMLCGAAEACATETKPVYVIGTEVPTPGGATESLTSVSVTTTESTELALESHRKAFLAAGLASAWERVIALVVQPGVEFGNDNVVDYEPGKAKHLSMLLREHPGLVFEAHSTDYQRAQAYRELVHDGFAILKVGPELTFAMRQALFALARIEEECIAPGDRSNLPEVLEKVMLKEPSQWLKHYHGTPEEQEYLRLHSYSDRIRYYWQYPEVQDAVQKLMTNLDGHPISESMLSDYLPEQYRKVRAGHLSKRPLPIVLDKISDVLEEYAGACVSR